MSIRYLFKKSSSDTWHSLDNYSDKTVLNLMPANAVS